MQHLQLAIDGMSCGHCVNAVTRALQDLPGVHVEHVAIGAATVAFDPNTASAEQIIDAVNDEGYVAHQSEAA